MNRPDKSTYILGAMTSEAKEYINALEEYCATLERTFNIACTELHEKDCNDYKDASDYVKAHYHIWSVREWKDFCMKSRGIIK